MTDRNLGILGRLVSTSFDRYTNDENVKGLKVWWEDTLGMGLSRLRRVHSCIDQVGRDLKIN